MLIPILTIVFSFSLYLMIGVTTPKRSKIIFSLFIGLIGSILISILIFNIMYSASEKEYKVIKEDKLISIDNKSKNFVIGTEYDDSDRETYYYFMYESEDNNSMVRIQDEDVILKTLTKGEKPYAHVVKVYPKNRTIRFLDLSVNYEKKTILYLPEDYSIKQFNLHNYNR